jgi:hypothetical protein
VVVKDVGVDAALVDGDWLVLSPHQSFSNAVDAVQRLLPRMPTDLVRSLIRTHLPDAPDLEIPPTPAAAQRTEVRWRVYAVSVISAAAVAVAGISASLYGSMTASTSAAAEPYARPGFQAFAEQGQILCQPIGDLAAKCTDLDGAVLLAEAAVTTSSTLYWFSYGRHFICLRVFRTEEDARRWVAQPGVREAYPTARVRGRYVIWGTDPVRLERYERALSRTTDAAAAPSVDGVSSIPAGVGALMLGTLGVTPDQLATASKVGLEGAMSKSQATAVRVLLAMPADEDEVESTPPPAPTEEPAPPPSTEPTPATDNATPEQSPEPSPEAAPTVEQTPTPTPRATPTPQAAPSSAPSPAVTGETTVPPWKRKPEPGPTWGGPPRRTHPMPVPKRF